MAVTSRRARGGRRGRRAPRRAAATMPSKAARGPIALAGGDGDDRLDGGAAARRRRWRGRPLGRSRRRRLAGGPGDDVLAGGPGADRLAGGEGDADVVDFSDARSRVSVTFDGIADDGARTSMTTSAPTSRASAAAARTTRSEAVRCSRAATARTTSTASAGADRLRGGAGGDTLRSRDDAARPRVVRARAGPRGGRPPSTGSSPIARPSKPEPDASPRTGRRARRAAGRRHVAAATTTGCAPRSAAPARTGRRADSPRGSTPAGERPQRRDWPAAGAVALPA